MHRYLLRKVYPTACHELCSVQLNFVPVSSNIRFLGRWDPKLSQIQQFFGIHFIFFKILHYMSQRTQMGPKITIVVKASKKLEIGYQVECKSYKSFRENGLELTYWWQNEDWCICLQNTWNALKCSHNFTMCLGSLVYRK